jgi:hypothetical protein
MNAVTTGPCERVSNERHQITRCGAEPMRNSVPFVLRAVASTVNLKRR